MFILKALKLGLQYSSLRDYFVEKPAVQPEERHRAKE